MKKETILKKIDITHSEIGELDNQVRRKGGVIRKSMRGEYKDPKKEYERLQKMKRAYKAQLKRLTK